MSSKDTTKPMKAKKAPAPKETKTKEVEVKNIGGRPTELTDETLKDILKNIRAGVPIKTAILMAGIVENTYYNWLKRGGDEEYRISKGGEPDPKEERFLGFLQSVKRAREEAKGAHIAVIANAGAQGDWRASAWWLSRQFREEFSDNPTPQYQQINNTLNISVTLSEIEKMLDALDARDSKVIDVEKSN